MVRSATVLLVARGASGDPHILNIFGERFDLQESGTHTLLRVPSASLKPIIDLEIAVRVKQLGLKEW